MAERIKLVSGSRPDPQKNSLSTTTEMHLTACPFTREKVPRSISGLVSVWVSFCQSFSNPSNEMIRDVLTQNVQKRDDTKYEPWQRLSSVYFADT